METLNRQVNTGAQQRRAVPRRAFAFFVIAVIAGISFAAGIYVSRADEPGSNSGKAPAPVRTVYPKNTSLDFEGTQIEGEIYKPGEFYFQHRPEEKFDSLVKRRPNFHQEMLRDAVLTK